ncbi:hypothetical protein D9C73_006982 [Collichthys lucidus]|uniref:Uncharacterized protein n=1 Tax=Collichthys lucidus TaxID=240159 RepID=A0A4U5UHH9_COLLU|nr:hypothetical protein D9C73_006982 [Collichthys lucidus]
MHRSYQPLKPVTNRYLQQRWDQNNYDNHRRKLQDERLSVIDRDNRLLASKLSNIVCSKGLVEHQNHYHLRRDETLKWKGEDTGQNQNRLVKPSQNTVVDVEDSSEVVGSLTVSVEGLDALQAIMEDQDLDQDLDQEQTHVSSLLPST